MKALIIFISACYDTASTRIICKTKRQNLLLFHLMLASYIADLLKCKDLEGKHQLLQVIVTFFQQRSLN